MTTPLHPPITRPQATVPDQGRATIAAIILAQLRIALRRLRTRVAPGLAGGVGCDPFDARHLGDYHAGFNESYTCELLSKLPW